MLSIKTFSRKEYTVNGVQVTEENMENVARWCGGRVASKPIKGIPTPFIKVDVHRPLNEKQTEAYVTDYVLLSNTGYKVYTRGALEKNFEEQGGDTFVDLVDYEEAGNLFDRLPMVPIAEEPEHTPAPTTGEKLGLDSISEPFSTRKQV